MPNNDPATNTHILQIKTKRTWGGTGAYSDYYKPDGSTMLLDKPYRPAANDRFYGDENSADIIINNSTDKASIDNINNILLGTSADDRMSGEISEIKVFAPPIVGGILTPNGTVKNADGTPQQFWLGGSRFGTATIKVTATQYRDPTLAMNAKIATANVLASHSVRFVVGEVPLPIPGGPIQSNTNISFGGDFIVHWGNETSTGDLTNKRNPTSLPWANAYERPHFEHGFEPGSSLASITVTNGGSGYATAPGVVTAITLSAAIGGHGSGYVPNPPPPTGTGTASWGPLVTISGGGGTGATALANIGSEVWPITGATFDDGDYFHELLGKSFEDPWFGSRSVGDNSFDGIPTPYPTFPQCNSYGVTTTETTASQSTYSFQWQSINVYPFQKRVIFPTIKYDLWKKVATNSRGLTGIYYFGYDSATGNFKLNNNGAAQKVSKWVNVNTNGMGPGVYFFDTVDGINPQVLTGAARAAELTPALSWNNSDFGGSFLMEGFVYLNSSSFGTTGMGNSATTVQAQFPGEPYRDVGYPKWDTVAGNWDTSCAGVICRIGAGDAVFSYQDLNGNGLFDVVTMANPAYRSWDPGAITHAAGTSQYVLKTWKSDTQAIADYGAKCTVPGTNGATDCTEPSEPYLNLIYPADKSTNVVVGWEASNAQTRRPKKFDNVGNPVSCSGSPTAAMCTSNAFDIDGAIVPLDTILQGILYNEGDYGSQGNATYYGSLLIQGVVTGTGTPDIWFDESLVKGTWAPPNMPRVMIFSEQSDEVQQ